MEAVAPAPRGPAAAQGRLSERPVPRLLVQLLKKRVTGRLVITDESGDESAVYLRDGSPVHVGRPNDLDRLDRVLRDSGLVSHVVLARAEELASQQNLRLGQVLLEIGALSRDALADVLRSQLRRKLTRTFFARKGGYEVFVEDHSFGEGDELSDVRIDSRCLVYPGIRAAYDDVRAVEELKPLGDLKFRLIEMQPGFLEALGFPANEATLEALRTRALRLDDLSGLGVRPFEAHVVVLSLLYNDLLSTEASGATVSPSRAVRFPSPVPPVVTPVTTTRTMSPVPERPRAATPLQVMAPASPAAVEARRKITDLAARLDSMSHFEVLGVTESATADEVSVAYMSAVRQYHPDKLAGLGLVDLVKQAERVMARFGEASSVLNDPQRRAEYMRKQRGEPTEMESARAILEAEVTFKKGEVALRKGDFAQAIAAFTEAARKNAAEPQYKAYLAWARYADPAARKDMLARETLRLIAMSAKDRPHFALAHYWMGEIHKHLGDIPSAEKAFNDAVEVDKDFIDAQRELRLINMRRAKAKPAAAPAGGDKPAPAPGGASAAADKAKAFFGKFLKR